MLRLAIDGALDDWTIDMDRLPATADFVAKVIRERYPQLDMPLHARWRHFVFAGRDLWREISASHHWPNPASQARAAFDLVISSVLLDAGAGSQWCYADATTGLTARRSEGLALASLRWFEGGGMSRIEADALRVDAAALQRVDAAALNAAFQASADNPLLGSEGRAALLNRLGAAVQARPELFAIADSPRPGGLFDALAVRAAGKPLPAATILEVLLDAFGTIWQDRPGFAGVPLGDCWPHPAFKGPRLVDGFVPLHKLSQWLAYSLIEPLQSAGIPVSAVDELTGLAEYRNGGLFVDMAVLHPRDPSNFSKTHAVSAAFIVGWRAMTVALLDHLAPMVAARLGVRSEALTLAQLLEGGTWAAGRMIARERRADGGPPFQITSDGTVF